MAADKNHLFYPCNLSQYVQRVCGVDAYFPRGKWALKKLAVQRVGEGVGAEKISREKFFTSGPPYKCL